MSKRRVAIGAAVILLAAGTVWAWMRTRTDAQVEKVKQLQAEAFKEGATPEQRRQNFELVHREMEKLSPEQRHEVWGQMHEAGQRRMDEHIQAYFALPPAQRVAYLDKDIKEMEKRQKEWESRRAQAGQAAGAGGPRGPGGGPPGMAGGPRPPRNTSTDARMQRRGQRLDSSTAEQRANRAAYFADMQQRRTQLGLPPMPRPGGGRPH